MAITIGVGPTVAEPGGSDTTLVFVLSGTTAGRSLIVGATCQNARTINSIACSGESNLTLVSQTGDGTVGLKAVWGYLDVLSSGGDKTITVTYDSSSSARDGIAVELIGANTSDVFDNSTGATGNSTNPSTTLTTGSDSAAIFAIGATAHGSGITGVGSGYTAIALANSGREGSYDIDVGAFGSKTVDYTAALGQWLIVAIALNAAPPPPGAGDVDFEPMSGMGGIWGTPSFQAMTAAAPPPFAVMTAFGQANIAGSPTFRAMTATGGATEKAGRVFFEALVGFGEAHGSALGAASFEFMTATGTTIPVNIASGGVCRFEPMDGLGLFNAEGSVAFEEMEAAGLARGPALGAVSFEPLGVQHISGMVSFEALLAYGTASEGLLSTFDTKVMNTRNTAVTEFAGFNFNSFARIGSSYYGAGPNGMFRLDGATDAGSDINWFMRTGRHDDKKLELKRLPEVVLSLRSDGYIMVRVWSDDNTSHDYKLPRVQTDTIHQHRVQPGKGLRSRYFGVELRGTKNATLEMDSMQINMTLTTRRLG